jgi:hypothetical protein
MYGLGNERVRNEDGTALAGGCGYIMANGE